MYKTADPLRSKTFILWKMPWKRGSGLRISIMESWKWSHFLKGFWGTGSDVTESERDLDGFRGRKWLFLHAGLWGRGASDTRELNSACRDGGRTQRIDEQRGGIQHLSGLGHIWLKYMSPVWGVIFISQPDKPEPHGQRYSLLFSRTRSQACVLCCRHNPCWLTQE